MKAKKSKNPDAKQDKKLILKTIKDYEKKEEKKKNLKQKGKNNAS